MKIEFIKAKVVDGSQMKGRTVEWDAEKAQPYINLGVAVEVSEPVVAEVAAAPSRSPNRSQE